MSDATEYPNYDKPCSICAQPMGLFASFDGKHCNLCWLKANATANATTARPYHEEHDVPHIDVRTIKDWGEDPRVILQQRDVQLRYRLVRDGAKVPVYSTPGSSGMDGFASRFQRPGDDRQTDAVTLDPGDRVVAHCGFAAEIPPGLELQARPRSGRARDVGLVVVPGTIDSDYRGEIGAVLMYLGQNEPLTLCEGDRVCQFVLAPVVRAEMVLVEELSQTERGDRGYGSSGR